MPGRRKPQELCHTEAHNTLAQHLATRNMRCVPARGAERERKNNDGTHPLADPPDPGVDRHSCVSGSAAHHLHCLVVVQVANQKSLAFCSNSVINVE